MSEEKGSQNSWKELIRCRPHLVRRNNEPVIYIHSRGDYSFNKSAIIIGSRNEYYEYFSLLFSADKNALVFHFHDKKQPGSIKATIKYNRRYNAEIFFNLCDFDYVKNAGKYLLIHEKIHGLGSCMVCYINTNKLEKRKAKSSVRIKDPE